MLKVMVCGGGGCHGCRSSSQQKAHRLGASGGGGGCAAAAADLLARVDDKGVVVAVVVVVEAATRGCGGGGLDLSSKYCRRREIMPTGGWTRSTTDTIRLVSIFTTAHEVELYMTPLGVNHQRRRRRKKEAKNNLTFPNRPFSFFYYRLDVGGQGDSFHFQTQNLFF